MDQGARQQVNKEKLKGHDQPSQTAPVRENPKVLQGKINLQRVIEHPEQARPADVVALRRASGNRAAHHLIQPKLEVGPAADATEQEADRVAEQVVDAPSTEARKAIRRQEDEEEIQTNLLPEGLEADRIVQRQEDEDEVQTKSLAEASLAGFQVNSQFEDQLKASRGHGDPLPNSLRAEMEPGFGADLSGVRVHHTSHDADLSRSISAQAFTLGQDIYLGAGKYDPSSRSGKRLLAHELTHTIQQGAAPQRMTQRIARITPQISTKGIQRKTLSPDSILSALLKIPFVSQKLQQTQHLRRDDVKDKGPKIQTMLAHIKEVLSAFSKNLSGGADKGTSQAISLAVVLEGVARIIAVNELNDPMLTPILTVKLIQLYRDEIGAALGKMDDKEKVIELATALTAGDPISLYMHDELRIEEAARQVRKMAMLANQDPVAFFDLLRQRFEIEMATQTEEKVRGRQDTATKFSVREATGEISIEYLKKLFPQVAKTKKQPAQVNPTWNKGQTKGARKELAFTPEAANKLDALKTAVGQHDVGFTGQNRTWTRSGETTTHTLSTRQSAHLEDIEQKDQSVNRGTLDGLVISKLQSMFNLNEEGAADVLGRIKSGLASLPLALSVKASDWFASGDPTTTIYKPGSARRNEANFSDLFGKKSANGKINYLGEFDDKTGQDRGKNYGRFRNWKDQKMTGNRGFSDKELPSFAAVQINWPAHGTDKTYGVDSYGDLHFVLKKANIANRLVYTATDHGHPRRDIYLAFCDFVLGDVESKSLTGLKKTESSHVVRQVVNSLITQQLVSTPLQCFEIQIFGELDVAKDVAMITVAPTTDPKIKLNVQNFCNRHNIVYEAIAKPVEAVLDGKWFSPMPDDKGRNMTNQLQTVLSMEQLPKEV